MTQAIPAHHHKVLRRLLGLRRLPDVATISRTLEAMHGAAAEQLRAWSWSP